jgi:cell wall-associated NlpC family hydrolase
MIDASILSSWEGVPFAWGASSREHGCDCAGLVLGIGKEAGYIPHIITIPPYGRHTSTDTILTYLEAYLAPSKDREPKPYRVALLKPKGLDAMHLAICLEGNQILHADQRAGKVVKVPLPTYYKIVRLYEYKEPNNLPFGMRQCPICEIWFAPRWETQVYSSVRCKKISMKEHHG